MSRMRKGSARRKKALAILAVVGLLAAIGGTAQCTRQAEVSEQAEAEAQAAQEQEAQQEAADEGLREDAQAVRDAYSQEVREAIAILAKSAWSAQDGSEARFTDRTVTEASAGSEAAERPYIITALERNRYRSSDSTIDETVIAMELPEGTRLLTLTRTIAGDSDAWAVSGDALQGAGEYKRAKLAQGLTVQGDIDAQLAPLLGSDTAQLRSLLADYCSVYYASASTATWSGHAEVDFNEKTVLTDFVLDNAAKTHIAMTYRTDTASYEFA